MPTYGSSAVVSHKDLPIQHVSSTQWGDMHYPNRKGYDFPSEFDKEIGFLKDK